jgi:hypothetical protein
MTKVSMVASFALVFFGVESARACSVPYIRTLNNQTVDGHMTARSGRPCSIRMRTSAGPTSGASIVQHPANGTLSIGGGNRIIYRSRPGFVGSDAFAYARHGLDRYNSPVTRTVRVAVRVIP